MEKINITFESLDEGGIKFFKSECGYYHIFIDDIGEKRCYIYAGKKYLTYSHTLTTAFGICKALYQDHELYLERNNLKPYKSDYTNIATKLYLSLKEKLIPEEISHKLKKIITIRKEIELSKQIKAEKIIERQNEEKQKKEKKIKERQNEEKQKKEKKIKERQSIILPIRQETEKMMAIIYKIEKEGDDSPFIFLRVKELLECRKVLIDRMHPNRDRGVR